MEQRYTANQVTSMLSVSEEQLRELMRLHRDTLPSRDPEYPSLYPENLVAALRNIVNKQEPGKTPTPAPRSKDERAMIFSITSGKGGVGKTSLSVNMAADLASRGYRTILVDTDLGLANTHILAGLNPTKTLSDYLEGNAELAEIIVDGPSGVKFISGGSGVREMANLDEDGRKRILKAVQQLRPFCDVILLDTGAGISSNVTDFISISDHTIVVTTSNFAAIADAYGIVKVMVQEGYGSAMHLVVNRVRSPEEAEQVYKKLKGCTERFLSFDLNWLGLLPEDQSVEGAVLKRIPFCEAYQGSVATRYLKKVVTAIERFLPTVSAPTT